MGHTKFARYSYALQIPNMGLFINSGSAIYLGFVSVVWRLMAHETIVRSAAHHFLSQKETVVPWCLTLTHYGLAHL